MPPTLTYPGVYIVEAPSGVHTITGVATSIAAFFGQASMGPLNAPIQCLSYSDYTRNFGAPVPGANLAQSVQEFFSNGGSECYVVRLAHGAAFAQVTLKNLATTGVLNLAASSPGIWGAGLSVTVDYNTPAPDSTFNLQVTYSSGAAIVQTETFANLSMDTSSPRYAPQFINQSSVLITANTTGLLTASGIPAGYSEVRGIPPTAANSWNAAIVAAWPSSIPDLGSFQISVDGGPWSTVTLSLTELKKPTYATDAATFAYFVTQINAAIGSPVSNTGVDVLLEMSGNPTAIQQGFATLRAGGRASLLGIPTESVPLDLVNDVIFKGATVQGIYGRRMYGTWVQMTALLKAGRLNLDPLFGERTSLEKFEEAFKLLRGGLAGKILMYPDGVPH